MFIFTTRSANIVRKYTFVYILLLFIYEINTIWVRIRDVCINLLREIRILRYIFLYTYIEYWITYSYEVSTILYNLSKMNWFLYRTYLFWLVNFQQILFILSFFRIATPTNKWLSSVYSNIYILLITKRKYFKDI